MVWRKERSQTRKGERYDWSNHGKPRAIAARRHKPTDPCARCGHELGPMGKHLHYDHADDGIGYLGFSHGTPCPVCGEKCNLQAGAVKGSAIAHGTPTGHLSPPPTCRQSRRWLP
jgi:hypothetical protein